VADDNLRGLALTVASAMEGVAGRDPSLASLSSFQAHDVAYAMLISPSGTLLFHSNSDLIGQDVDDLRYRDVLASGSYSERRISLGTEEQVYEFQAPFHLAQETCVLRLGLHTWRAEAVMRRARFGIILIFSLLAVGWGLGLTVVWLLRRQDAQEHQLARRNELERLGEMGAVLAHEVRNPLAGIKGYGQLLEERLPAGREHDYAGLIVRESLRLEQLTNDILFYTGSEALTSPGHPETVIVQLVALLEPQLEQAGIRLNVQVESGTTVTCSDDALHRLLLNLLTNAMQAMPDGGDITLTLQRVGAMVELSVVDTGSGIAPDMLSGLFTPFRTSKARGAGLGLAVCQKIVESCGGSIRADQALSGGAVFWVKLPLASSEVTV
jgi:two-component system sensor histidine kinase HydH